MKSKDLLICTITNCLPLSAQGLYFMNFSYLAIATLPTINSIVDSQSAVFHFANADEIQVGPMEILGVNAGEFY